MSGYEVRYEVRHRRGENNWHPWYPVSEQAAPEWVRDALALVFDRSVVAAASSGATEWRNLAPEPAPADKRRAESRTAGTGFTGYSDWEPVLLSHTSPIALVLESEPHCVVTIDRAGQGRIQYRDTPPNGPWRTCGWVGSDATQPTQPLRPASLSFAELHEANLARCRRWHPGFPDDEAWTGADWSNAMAGEGGELIEAAAMVAAATGKVSNTVKKIRRYETGTDTAVDKPLDALWVELDAEMADVACYLDLLATKYGRDLAGAIVAKFNAVSERQGFPERLGAEGTRAVCPLHERALIQCDCWCTCPSAVRGAHGADCRQGVAPVIRRKQASA